MLLALVSGAEQWPSACTEMAPSLAVRDRAADTQSVSRRCRRAGVPAATPPRAVSVRPRPDLGVGDGAGGFAAQRLRQDGALHTGALGGANALRGRSRGFRSITTRRTGPARPRRRSQESLRLPIAPRHSDRGAFLHALRDCSAGRRRSTLVCSSGAVYSDRAARRHHLPRRSAHLNTAHVSAAESIRISRPPQAPARRQDATTSYAVPVPIGPHSMTRMVDTRKCPSCLPPSHPIRCWPFGV
jgi:hypothetical protein